MAAAAASASYEPRFGTLVHECTRAPAVFDKVDKTPFPRSYARPDDVSVVAREYFSNWYDEIIRKPVKRDPAARKACNSVKFTGAWSADRKSYIARAVGDNGYEFGYLQYERDGAPDLSGAVHPGPVLHVVNYNTRAARSRFVRIGSTKSGTDDNVVGVHGEGSKIAALHALRLGGSVTVTVGKQVLDYCFVPQVSRGGADSDDDAGGDDSSEDAPLVDTDRLCIRRSERTIPVDLSRRDQHQFSKVVSVLVSGCKAQTPLDFFDPDKFPCIAASDGPLLSDRYGWEDSRGNRHCILFSPAARGRFFIKGVFVRHDPNLSFGFDTNGSTLGRDRNRAMDEPRLLRDLLGTYVLAIVARPQLVGDLYEKLASRVPCTELWYLRNSAWAPTIFAKIAAPLIDAVRAEFDRRHPGCYPMHAGDYDLRGTDRFSRWALRRTPARIDDRVLHDLLWMREPVANRLALIRAAAREHQARPESPQLADAFAPLGAAVTRAAVRCGIADLHTVRFAFRTGCTDNCSIARIDGPASGAAVISVDARVLEGLSQTDARNEIAQIAFDLLAVPLERAARFFESVFSTPAAVAAAPAPPPRPLPTRHVVVDDADDADTSVAEAPEPRPQPQAQPSEAAKRRFMHLFDGSFEVTACKKRREGGRTVVVKTPVLQTDDVEFADPSSDISFLFKRKANPRK